jgi:hypothetical protein
MLTRFAVHFLIAIFALALAPFGMAAEADSQRVEQDSTVQSAQKVGSEYYLTCFQAGKQILGQGLSGYPMIGGVKSSGKLHIRGQTKDGRVYEVWVSADTTCRIGQK